MLRVGTAGWSIPRAVADRFPAQGSGLERYAARFDCVEINSSFHRPHRRSTWERWAASVPDGFRFAAKLPKSITHTARLTDCDALMAAFAAEVMGLGDRLGVILVQLPPSLAFDAERVDAFLARLRAAIPADISLEPRHPSWFAPEADALLARHRTARVAADPVLHPGAGTPGGWRGFAYYRLHGSPRTYYSTYEGAFIGRLADEVAALGTPAWCIFDNTAGSAAAGNALDLRAALG